MTSTAALLAQGAAYPHTKHVKPADRSLSRPGRPTTLSPVIPYADLAKAPALATVVSAASTPSPAAVEHAQCPFTAAGSADSAPSTPPEVPVDNSVLTKRIEDEVTKGVRVTDTDSGYSTLYLPPLLSLLPESVTSSALPSRAASPTNPETAVSYTLSRLPSIDKASLSLHRALHAFRPTTPLYAIHPYPDSFNWDELVLEDVEEAGDVLDIEREWYIVAFRSQRRRDLEEHEAKELYEKDRAAHEEAVTHGGLISYWFGSPIPLSAASPSSSASPSPSSSPTPTPSSSLSDASLASLAGRNLATCIWSSRAAALAALRGPLHAQAAKLAVRTYETYRLERWVLRKEAGSRAVRVVPWEGRECVGA
ncbi:hypothetical protein JCM8097_008185 [Rhodosporidiobolus ruineniae]